MSSQFFKEDDSLFATQEALIDALIHMNTGNTPATVRNNVARFFREGYASDALVRQILAVTRITAERCWKHLDEGELEVAISHERERILLSAIAAGKKFLPFKYGFHRPWSPCKSRDVLIGMLAVSQKGPSKNKPPLYYWEDRLARADAPQTLNEQVRAVVTLVYPKDWGALIDAWMEEFERTYRK